MFFGIVGQFEFLRLSFLCCFFKDRKSAASYNFKHFNCKKLQASFVYSERTILIKLSFIGRTFITMHYLTHLLPRRLKSDSHHTKNCFTCLSESRSRMMKKVFISSKKLFSFSRFLVL